MDGEAFCRLLREELDVKNNQQLSSALGVTAAAVSNLQKTQEVTPRRFAGFLKRAITHSIGSEFQSAIHPIVEFFPVKPTLKRTGKNKTFLEATKNPKIIQILKKEIGIYSFYNSEGRIIYLGKTKNNFWLEMNQTFNRDITNYKISLVDHKDEKYVEPKGGKPHQIKPVPYSLSDAAAYFSCYQVQRDLIDILESFAIRIIPNNVINRKMEKAFSAYSEV